MADLLDPPRAADWRCSAFARDQGLDPIGSIGSYDTVLLVEVPLPWPRDVGEISEIGAAMAAVAEQAPEHRVRVLAIVPEQASDGTARLVTRWRNPFGPASDGVCRARSFDGTDHRVAAADLASHLVDLVLDRGDPGSPAPRDMVICTHGRRDVCCGKLGSALFEQAARRWPDVRVRRTSHTGGHRFAPTGLTFPEARGWAYLALEVLDAVVARVGDAAAVAAHSRGFVALPVAAQVAERELLVRRGWDALDAEIDVTPLDGIDPDSGTAGVRLRWTLPDGITGSASAGVGVRRRVPTLACGSPPDESTKTDAEYELRTFAVDAG